LSCFWENSECIVKEMCFTWRDCSSTLFVPHAIWCWIESTQPIETWLVIRRVQYGMKTQETNAHPMYVCYIMRLSPATNNLAINDRGNFVSCAQIMRKILIYSIRLCIWPPLRSSGQKSWLQIKRCEFDSRHYQIFWELVGLERGPLSLVSTIEGLLERKSSSFGLKIREYDRRDPLRWPPGTLHPEKLALTSPISRGRSVGSL
jgi:hypothetical protein